MGTHLRYGLGLVLAIAGIGGTGCIGGMFSEEGAPPLVPPPGAGVCPMDPDAYIGGDPSLYECPEFWVCEDLAGERKRCFNPGPDYPDGGDWECRDEGGTTVCRGSDFPDGGGDGDWDCERQAEFVICTNDRPDYPDEGGGSPWDCWFQDEYRICEGGDTPGYPDGGGDFCFFPTDGGDGGAVVRGGYRFETRGGRDVVHVTLIFDEAFVDNTYGTNSSDGYRGGDRGHTFRDLVSSDHAEVGFADGSGREVLRAKFDYISPSDVASGYDSLGATGGDGRMMTGDDSAVVDATSSLAHNFNELGCVFTEDSPGAGECPGWEPRVIYEMWIDAALFGAAGFGGPLLEYVHASPSRTDDTIWVEPGECP